MEDLIITAALTGGITSAESSPHLPITPGEIEREVRVFLLAPHGLLQRSGRNNYQ